MGKRKRFVWTLEVEVAEAWVADGFDLTAERMTDILRSGPLGYALSGEVVCRLVKAPPRADVLELQGYAAEAKRERMRDAGWAEDCERRKR